RLPTSRAALSSLLYRPAPHRDLHSFPTRRSSDLSQVDDSAPGAHFVYLAGALRQFDLAYLHLVAPDAVEPESLDRALAVQMRRRSEEHTSELQSRENLVCRLLLEKKTAGAGQAPP